MRKLKPLVIAAVLVLFGTSAFAADATVTFVSGKVEVQRGGKWVALQKGDTVAKSETISTGFQSEAKIKMMDSVMYLGPVTRITLEELSTVDQTDNVNIYLKTGTARSQVKHVDNKRVNYQVHTAVAVASCRGTGWIIDDSNNILGLDGTLSVSALKALGAEMGGVLLKANQSIKVSDNNKISVALNTVVSTASTVTQTVTTAAAKEGEGGAGGVGGATADVAGAGEAGSDSDIPYVPAVVDTPDDTPVDETGSVVVTLEIPE